MSVYTVEVRYICEVEAGLIQSSGYNDVDEVIDKSWGKIFKAFPIFDESYREGLCKKILNHYYTREIGAETTALWKFWLNQKMNEIMPYYNKLYISEQLKYDPLHEIDFTRTITENTNANKTGQNNSTESNAANGSSNGYTDMRTTGQDSNTGKNDSTHTENINGTTATTNGGATTVNTSSNGQDLHSDTPQGTINNLSDGNYLSDAHLTSDTTDSTTTIDTNSTTTNSSNNTDTTNSSSSNTYTTDKSTVTRYENTNKNELESNNKNEFSENNKGIREYIEHITGKNSSTSYTKLVQEYRESLLNIDMDIIFELKDLFMNIY